MSDTPYRIFVVDDEPVLRRLLPLTLNKILGARAIVLTFENGQKAWDSLQNRTPEDLPHLVLTDTEMPEMNGITLTEKIRSTYTSIGVIRISGKADTNPDLVKPFETIDLASYLRTYDPAYTK